MRRKAHRGATKDRECRCLTGFDIGAAAPPETFAWRRLRPWPLASGCQVRPLYGTTATGFGSDTNRSTDLAAIDIESINSQYLTTHARVLQRTDLPLRAWYDCDRAKNTVEGADDTSHSSEIGVEQFSDVPSAYTLTMNSTFVLSDLASDKTLMTGRSFQSASYDFSNQRFANLSAQRDAQKNACKGRGRRHHSPDCRILRKPS
jgi:LPS-assembly lipoprotein